MHIGQLKRPGRLLEHIGTNFIVIIYTKQITVLYTTLSASLNKHAKFQQMSTNSGPEGLQYDALPRCHDSGVVQKTTTDS